ncbi:MAG: hypothetical protein OXB88_07905 [Bacteriovoracales bacterium]|nr:hypothetical protein [Bacteriovoracales bacterium]
MEKSKVFKLKSKFFIYRVISYFSFLLIPIWATKLEGAGMALQMPTTLLYIFFMVGQWFLLGKEIDYRLKIYFHVNSSIDRVIYRILLGKLTMLLYFGLLGLLAPSVLKYFFWGTWLLLGLFYSWPTRGKIIRESLVSNFTEFRFLSYLEKTVVVLCILLFLISIPKFPGLVNVEALKLVLDPHEKMAQLFWNFMHITYFPFYKYPLIYKTAWNLHFYCIGLIILVLTFYSLSRYFFFRRVSILGIFALLSSWSYPKLLALNLHWAITSTFLVTWIWAILWATQSRTYRCGFFLGLLSFWGTLINPSYFFLMPIQIFLLYFIFFRNQTTWFKVQVLKYMSIGAGLSLMAFISRLESFLWIEGIGIQDIFSQVMNAIKGKAFFLLSLFGIILISLKLYVEIFKKNYAFIQDWRIDVVKLKEFSICIFIVTSFSFFFDSLLFYGFSVLWLVCLLSLVPVEWIFQSLARLHSKRNLIYGIYILVCLLDSHIEGRLKILMGILR